MAMGMPLLQRRRFLMSAAVAEPLLAPSAEAALAQLQNAAATAQSVPGWLQVRAISVTFLWVRESDCPGAQPKGYLDQYLRRWVCELTPRKEVWPFKSALSMTLCHRRRTWRSGPWRSTRWACSTSSTSRSWCAPT